MPECKGELIAREGFCYHLVTKLTSKCHQQWPCLSCHCGALGIFSASPQTWGRVLHRQGPQGAQEWGLLLLAPLAVAPPWPTFVGSGSAGSGSSTRTSFALATQAAKSLPLQWARSLRLSSGEVTKTAPQEPWQGILMQPWGSSVPVN